MESAGMESAAGPKQPAALGTNGLSLRDFLSEISNNGLDEAEECFEEREAPDGAVPFFQLASSRSGFQEPRIPDQPGNSSTGKEQAPRGRIPGHSTADVKRQTSNEENDRIWTDSFKIHPQLLQREMPCASQHNFAGNAMQMPDRLPPVQTASFGLEGAAKQDRVDVPHEMAAHHNTSTWLGDSVKTSWFQRDRSHFLSQTESSSGEQSGDALDEEMTASFHHILHGSDDNLDNTMQQRGTLHPPHVHHDLGESLRCESNGERNNPDPPKHGTTPEVHSTVSKRQTVKRKLFQSESSKHGSEVGSSHLEEADSSDKGFCAPLSNVQLANSNLDKPAASTSTTREQYAANGQQHLNNASTSLGSKESLEDKDLVPERCSIDPICCTLPAWTGTEFQSRCSPTCSEQIRSNADERQMLGRPLMPFNHLDAVPGDSENASIRFGQSKGKQDASQPEVPRDAPGHGLLIGNGVLAGRPPAWQGPRFLPHSASSPSCSEMSTAPIVRNSVSFVMNHPLRSVRRSRRIHDDSSVSGDSARIEDQPPGPQGYRNHPGHGPKRSQSLPLSDRRRRSTIANDNRFQAQPQDLIRDGICTVANLIQSTKLGSPFRQRHRRSSTNGCSIHNTPTRNANRSLLQSCSQTFTLSQQPSIHPQSSSTSLTSGAPTSRSLSATLECADQRRPIDGDGYFVTPCQSPLHSMMKMWNTGALPPMSEQWTAHATLQAAQRRHSMSTVVQPPGCMRPTPNKTLETVKATAHYLSLVLAEHPVEEHQRFLSRRLSAVRTLSGQANVLGAGWGKSRLEEILTSSSGLESSPHRDGIYGIHQTSSLDMSPARPRRLFTEQSSMTAAEDVEVGETFAWHMWRSAVKTIITSGAMVDYASTMADPNAAPDDRFHAVVRLEMMLWNNPSKRRVVAVLINLVKGKKPSVAELFRVEVLTTGERCLDWFTPAAMDHHRQYFSWAYVVVVLVVFFFMAGEYEFYLLRNGQEAYLEHSAGPLHLLAWIRNPDTIAFSPAYLRLWGARYAQDLADGQFYRWYSSIFVHSSFPHLLSNVLLTIAMSAHLESKYGAWRIFLVWSLSCSGGQLLSAAFEDICSIVVGASGGVFGMIGLFVADMVVNFQTIKRPLLRCLLIMVFVVFFVITFINDVKISHLSHVGGLICGLFLSFLFLPKLRKGRRWEMLLPALGLGVFVLFYIAIPVYLYCFRFKSIDCVLPGGGHSI